MNSKLPNEITINITDELNDNAEDNMSRAIAEYLCDVYGKYSYCYNFNWKYNDSYKNVIVYNIKWEK